ncbi:MAG: hypothetical protein IIZ45_02285, partial [Firmicutes bacterium]|nr:hypothetical protein [Bacillota bacterium]
MYPLVHYYVNQQVFGHVSHLTALGALWPDLAVGAGGNRDDAHSQGVAFYEWCRLNMPGVLDAARGMIGHGIDPPCVDYYADEFWPDHIRGYMFREALPYLPQVAACTGLDGDVDIPLLPPGGEPPRSNVWWKAHNLVEMAYEMITARQHPTLGAQLLEAVADDDAVDALAQALNRWQGLAVQPIIDIFAAVPTSYALIDAEAMAQAKMQAASMHHRF